MLNAHPNLLMGKLEMLGISETQCSVGDICKTVMAALPMPLTICKLCLTSVLHSGLDMSHPGHLNCTPCQSDFPCCLPHNVPSLGGILCGGCHFQIHTSLSGSISQLFWICVHLPCHLRTSQQGIAR